MLPNFIFLISGFGVFQLPFSADVHTCAVANHSKNMLIIFIHRQAILKKKDYFVLITASSPGVAWHFGKKCGSNKAMKVSAAVGHFSFLNFN